MARTTVRLTFPPAVINDPVIYQLGKQYQVVTNIHRADMHDELGWVELELDGEPAELDRALEFCRSRGISVERLSS